MVYIGHMALINTLISECRLNDLDSVVYTFNKHPQNILRKTLIDPLITTNEQKLSCWKELSDYLYYESLMKPIQDYRPGIY